MNASVFAEISDIYYKTTTKGKGRGVDVRVFPDMVLDDEAKRILGEFIDGLNLPDAHDSSMHIFSGIAWRITKIVGVRSEVIVLRHVKDSAADSLHSLGYPESLDNITSDVSLNKGGLILVSGGHGVGKTTAATAIIRSRLLKYGGLCLTIEDPPEIVMDGDHGDGFCIQVFAQNGDYRKALRNSLRSFPAKSGQMLFIGEIRDADTAYQAIVSSVEGQLVIATVHGLNIVSTLSRLASMSSRNQSEVGQLLATGLRLVINIKENNAGRIAQVFQNDSHTEEYIRSGDYNGLNSVVDRQMNLLRTAHTLEGTRKW